MIRILFLEGRLWALFRWSSWARVAFHCFVVGRCFQLNMIDVQYCCSHGNKIQLFPSDHLGRASQSYGLCE